MTTASPGSLYRKSHARAASFVVWVSFLAVDPWGWDAFGPLRWWLVSVSVALAATLKFWRGTVVIDRRVTAVFGLLLVWLAVAAAFGEDPLHAWLGTPDRHLGVLAWVLFFAAFLVGQALVRQQSVLQVARAVALAGGVVGLYALVELLGWAVVDVSFDGDRVGGPWGQPAFLAAGALLALPISVGLAVESTHNARWRVAAIGAAVLQLVAVLASQTRGAWVGLIVVALAAGWLGRDRLVPWVRQAGTGLMGVALGAVVVVGLVLALVTPLGSRAVSSFDLGEGTAQGRVDEWRVATSALVDRPFLGAGPEGYRVVFAEAVDDTYQQRHGRTVLPDRAHNGLLDLGVAGGVPALALYLALAVILVSRLRLALRSESPILVGVGVAVAMYVVQQQFLFPLAELDGVFWLLAGVLCMHTSSEASWLTLAPPRWLRVPAVAMVAALFVAGGADVLADHQTAQAQDALAAGSFVRANAAIDRAISLRPDSTRYRFVASRVASQSGDLALALDRVEDGLELSPRDPAFLTERAQLLVDQALAGGDMSVALAELEQRVQADPNNATYRLQYGILLGASGRADAEAQLLEAGRLAPTNPVPDLNLGLFYLQAGRVPEAADAADRAAAIAPGDPRVVALRQQIEQVR